MSEIHTLDSQYVQSFTTKIKTKIIVCQAEIWTRSNLASELCHSSFLTIIILPFLEQQQRVWLEAIEDVGNPFIISAPDPLCCLLPAPLRGNYTNASKPTPGMQDNTFFSTDYFRWNIFTDFVHLNILPDIVFSQYFCAALWATGLQLKRDYVLKNYVNVSVSQRDSCVQRGGAALVLLRVALLSQHNLST